MRARGNKGRKQQQETLQKLRGYLEAGSFEWQWVNDESREEI